MTEAKRFGLADIDAIDVDRQHAAQLFQHAQLALGFQFDFQFVRLVEMVGDGTLAAANDEDQIGNTRCRRLLRRILNQGLVDNGQHFLRIGLGRRKKTSAESCGGKNRFGYAFHCVLSPCWINSKNAASSRILMPNSCAFASFVPASAPATT